MQQICLKISSDYTKVKSESARFRRRGCMSVFSATSGDLENMRYTKAIDKFFEWSHEV